jgi:hypothetical protein
MELHIRLSDAEGFDGCSFECETLALSSQGSPWSPDRLAGPVLNVCHLF